MWSAKITATGWAVNSQVRRGPAADSDAKSYGECIERYIPTQCYDRDWENTSRCSVPATSRIGHWSRLTVKSLGTFLVILPWTSPPPTFNWTLRPTRPLMSSETFNVVLFGAPKVGKTSSLIQLREKKYGPFDDSFATEDKHYTEVVVDGEKAVLVVLDTATCTSREVSAQA